MAPAPTSTITTTETIIVVATSTTNTMGRGTMMEDVGVMEIQDMEVKDMEIQDMEVQDMEVQDMGYVETVMVINITRIIAPVNAVKPDAHLSTHKASSLTVASMGTRSMTGRLLSLQNVTVPTGKEVFALSFFIYEGSFSDVRFFSHVTKDTICLKMRV